jgi:hypothetical protein
MDAIVRSPLPSMLSEALPNSRAPSLRGHYPASSLLRVRPPPSRRRPLSRANRSYGLPSSADFAAGRGGLLQLPDVSCAPCRRSHPAGGDSSVSQPATLPAAFAHKVSARPPESSVEAILAFTHVTARPLAPIRPMVSSMGFSALASRRPAIQVTGRLAVAPVGLPPTEHVRLLWTHTSSTITPESHSSRPRQGCTGRQARRAPRGGKDRGDSRSQWPASSLPPPSAVVRTAGRAHHHEHPSRRQLLALQLRRLTNNPAFPCRDGTNTYLHTSRSHQADDS